MSKRSNLSTEVSKYVGLSTNGKRYPVGVKANSRLNVTSGRNIKHMERELVEDIRRITLRVHNNTATHSNKEPDNSPLTPEEYRNQAA